MARRKPAADVEEFEYDQESFELLEFIENIGPQIERVYLYRVPKFGSMEYIERFTVDVLKDGAEDYIFEQYGPGQYHLKFRGNDGKWKLQKTFHIGSRERQTGDGRPAHAAQVQHAAGESEHVKLMREQMAQQQTLLTALVQGLAGRSGPDPAAMLTAVVAAFAALKQASGGAGDHDWLAKAKTIIELAKDIAPEPAAAAAAGEDNLYSVIKDIGAKVVEAFQAAGRPALPAAGAPARLAAAPDAALIDRVSGARLAPPSEAATMRENSNNVVEWIRIGLAYLKKKAQQGKDPEIYVDWILDNNDEPQCAALEGAVAQGATFEQLLQFDPEISQTPAVLDWFRALYDGLHSEIFKAVDTAGAGGNAHYAGEDAGHHPSGEIEPHR